MKTIKLIALITLLFGCKSTLEIKTTDYKGKQEIIIHKGYKRVCLVQFEGDTIYKLVDNKDKVIKDSVFDFEVLSTKKPLSPKRYLKAK